MSNENRVLNAATGLLEQATQIWHAARTLARLGRDDETETFGLEELLAPLQGWCGHFQEEVSELARRQQPPG
jgi:hypothetical protein